MGLFTPLKESLLGPLHLPSLPSSHSLTSQYAQRALVSIDLSLSVRPFVGHFMIQAVRLANELKEGLMLNALSDLLIDGVCQS